MVQKETSLSKINRMTGNQKNIRNVATSAHIHHGKCISGNSKIILANGKVKTAREIFEDVITDGEICDENEDHVTYIPKRKVEILSLNQDKEKIENKEVEYAWRLKGGNTIKIKLRNGFEITTTPEHRYLVYRDGLVYAEAKDIKLGERVVCARRLESDSVLEFKKEILLKLSKYNFYAKLESNYSSELNKKILKYGIKKLNLTIKPRSFYHGIWQNRYNLKDIIEACRTFNLNFEEVYDKIRVVFYR